MLVLPSNNGSGGNTSCDVDRNYVDTQLIKKVDKTVYDSKIKEIENSLTVVYETVEG